MRDHPSFYGRTRQTATVTAGLPITPEPAAVYRPARRYSGRACCCPAPPAVIVIMPPAPGRASETDLLLCGHHFRASRQALATAGATILDVRGYPLTAGAWPEPPSTTS